MSQIDTVIRSSLMRSVYGRWRQLQTARGELPSLSMLRPGFGAATEHMVIYEVVDVAPFKLKQIFVGMELLRHLEGVNQSGMHTDTLTIEEECPFGGLETSYRRCMRLREAEYEYFHMKSSCGDDIRFERLLMPCMECNLQEHHLVNMMLFENI